MFSVQLCKIDILICGLHDVHKRFLCGSEKSEVGRYSLIGHDGTES
jgi:hypothetical protein